MKVPPAKNNSTIGRFILLIKNDVVGIIACSDGLSKEYQDNLNKIINILNEFGLHIKLAKTIFKTYGPFSGNPKDRANELMSFYSDKSVKAIFDISGGDSANELLDYLDYNIMKENPKIFMGMSDLTVLLNAINKCSGNQTYHYSIGNLIGDDSKKQKKMFGNQFLKNDEEAFKFNYQFIRGKTMSVEIIGGNIRCFLKLTGTKYFPSPRGKILFLESLGGGPSRMSSLFHQLKHIGYFDNINGIILGSFTVMESNDLKPDILKLILDVTEEYNIPIVKTDELGHGEDSKCIIIGKDLILKV